MMAGNGKRQVPDGKAIRELLKRYKCPIPYHQVRATFMGSIATPETDCSPLGNVKRIWKDDPPVFESGEEAKVFYEAMLTGLWNGLVRHQEPGNPFKLAKIKPTKPGRAHVATFARVRRQEIYGFIDGIFGVQEGLHFPETAHAGLETLKEMRASFMAVEKRANGPAGPSSSAGLRSAQENLKEMTSAAEDAINTIILSCRKARALPKKRFLMEHEPIPD